MLASLRNVAGSVVMVVAGFLAVALADCVWIILSFSDARVFFFGDPTVAFGNELYFGSSTIAEFVVGLAGGDMADRSRGPTCVEINRGWPIGCGVTPRSRTYAPARWCRQVRRLF